MKIKLLTLLLIGFVNQSTLTSDHEPTKEEINQAIINRKASKLLLKLDKENKASGLSEFIGFGYCKMLDKFYKIPKNLRPGYIHFVKSLDLYLLEEIPALAGITKKRARTE